MKPLVSCAALLVSLLVEVHQAVVMFDTSPGTTNGSTIVYISAALGEQNVTVVCSATTSSVDINSAWRNEDGTIFVFPASGGSPLVPASGYSFLSVENLFRELTIDIFTADLDRLMLFCGTTFEDELFVTFFFGIPILTLLNASEVYNVIEFQDFFLDLTDDNKTSFPPQVQSIWTIDGKEITDPQIAITDYSINITNISRSYSGQAINLTVSNNAGEGSEQFVLNVVYQPEVVKRADSVISAILGDVINITAAKQINGNPYPTLTWFGPDNTVINYEGRFLQPVEGTLTIQGLQQNDFGNYRFTAINGIGNDTEINVSLSQLIQPSQPRNLSYDIQSLTSTKVMLEWNPPLNVGIPMYLNYIIAVTSDSNSTTHHVTNDTVLILDDLDPGTFYNVTVSAASTVFTNGGEQSQSISFMTDTTGPVIRSVTGVSQNGSIYVHWSLQSTGGIALAVVTVRVTCGTLTTTEGKEATYDCNGNCIDSNLNGSSLVGPVHAGFKYRCVVTVRNGVQFQSIPSSAIDASTGIPSSPAVIINTRIVLMTQFTGVNSIEVFTFNVNIYDKEGQLVSELTYTGSNETEVTIMLTAGMYTVDVTSENTYGISDATTVAFVVDQSTIPSASPNTTSKNELSITYITVGGAGIAIILAVLSIVIVIIAYTVHKKAKYKSMTFTSNGKLPPQQRKQFDRPRIPSVGSTVLY